jgi:hypothetical protein
MASEVDLLVLSDCYQASRNSVFSRFSHELAQRHRACTVMLPLDISISFMALEGIWLNALIRISVLVVGRRSGLGLHERWGYATMFCNECYAEADIHTRSEARLLGRCGKCLFLLSLFRGGLSLCICSISHKDGCSERRSYFGGRGRICSGFSTSIHSVATS